MNKKSLSKAQQQQKKWGWRKKVGFTCKESKQQKLQQNKTKKFTYKYLYVHRKGHGSTYVKLLVVVKSREQNVRMRDFLFLYELLQRLTFLHYNEFFFNLSLFNYKRTNTECWKFQHKRQILSRRKLPGFPYNYLTSKSYDIWKIYLHIIKIFLRILKQKYANFLSSPHRPLYSISSSPLFKAGSNLTSKVKCLNQTRNLAT